MKRRTVLTLITATGVILLIGVEVFSKQLEHHFGLEEAGIVRLEVGFLAFIVLLVMNLVFHFTSIQTEETVEQIHSYGETILTNMASLEGRITFLSSTQLYRELLLAANAAQNRIYNCYFGEWPPTESRREKKDYFTAISHHIKKKGNISFRRIVLLTSGNLPWIMKLVDEYKDNPNVSMAVYLANPGSVLPLSVQLFDDLKAFLVRVAARPPGQPRDIAITARGVVVLLDDYYENMWRASKMIIDMGRVQREVVDNLPRMLTICEVYPKIQTTP